MVEPNEPASLAISLPAENHPITYPLVPCALEHHPRPTFVVIPIHVTIYLASSERLCQLRQVVVRRVLVGNHLRVTHYGGLDPLEGGDILSSILLLAKRNM